MDFNNNLQADVDGVKDSKSGDMSSISKQLVPLKKAGYI
jgi:hypothetical protein